LEATTPLRIESNEVMTYFGKLSGQITKRLKEETFAPSSSQKQLETTITK
jgi:hypothetical protein